MDYEKSPFHIKYRPQNFDEFVGNSAVIESLSSVLAKEDRPHSLLFTGPSGSGKTTIARIIAKELQCSDKEFYELNAANTRGIDTVREMIRSSNYAPLEGPVKIFLLDEAANITGAAAEALLKFLEDTPDHVYIILCTTAPEKLTKTVRNRCTTFHLSYLNTKDMKDLLQWVLINEQAELSDEVEKSLLFTADGCPRKLLVLLDQIVDIPTEEGRLQAIQTVSLDEVQVIDICRKLISNEKGPQRWEALKKMIQNVDQEPESIRRSILGYLTSVLLNSSGPKASYIAKVMIEFSTNYYDSGKSGLAMSCFMTTLL